MENEAGEEQCIFLLITATNKISCITDESPEYHESIWSHFNLFEKDPEVCNWGGVKCNANGNVVKISLQTQYLEGRFPPMFCQLRDLQELDLSRNQIVGALNLSECNNLVRLNLSSNYLSGNLSALSHLSKLSVLDLAFNKFSGNIVQQVMNLTSLRSLNLSHNNFQGINIHSIGNLSLIEEIRLSHNSLSGQLPIWINVFRGLKYVDLSQNDFSGPIPDIVLTNLVFLEISDNKFSGKIPKSITQLHNLEYLIANQNEITGTIRKEFGSLPSLRCLHLSNNRFFGTIPHKLFSSSKLESLDLSSNQLVGTIPQSIFECKDLMRIMLANNGLGGTLSPKIGELRDLQYFNIDGNLFHGEIPPQVAHCKSLTMFSISQNGFTGTVPKELASLGKLQELDVSQNYLSGEFPSFLSNYNNLVKLDLSSNIFSGIIPDIFSTLQKIQSLHLQDNIFAGSIPRSIGNLEYLLDLNLAHNKLNGEIPREIGMCSNLQIALNLSHNFLEGGIPIELSKLNSLLVLDLSRNRLIGEIPIELQDMQSLIFFDVSNNSLRGILPKFNKDTNININETSLSDSGFSTSNRSSDKKSALFIILSVSGAFIVLISIGLAVMACKWSNNETLERKDSSIMVGYLKDPEAIPRESIDFAEALKAELDPANIILQNDLSTYYKVAIPSGTVYTVKELNWLDTVFTVGIYQKLHIELEKEMKLSHHNIMMPLAYAFKNNLARLLYGHVPKGSLRDFINNNSEFPLDWPSRHKIAVGVAQGLSYLHGIHPPIIHLDLSSRNILLKSLTEPQIGDIELCIVADPTNTTLAGSFGYIPPEYAYAMKVTTASNVYSFGVILMELLSGLHPIVNGMDLAQWVQSTPSRKETWEQILDPRISSSSYEVRNHMLAVLKIALGCIKSSANSRPKMISVCAMLQTTVQV